jgi:hypothetical protein
MLQFLGGCSKWYVSVVFLTGQVLGNWIVRGSGQMREITNAWSWGFLGVGIHKDISKVGTTSLMGLPSGCGRT